MEWRVRDANISAIEFYERLGAKSHDGWTIYSFDDQALAALREQ